MRAYRVYRRICEEIFYWSPSGGAMTRVDFFLKQEGRFSAV